MLSSSARRVLPLSRCFSGTASADSYSGTDRVFLIEAGLIGASAGWQADGIQLAHQICMGFAGGGLTAAEVRRIGTSRFGTWVGDRIAGAAVDNYCPFNRPADLGPTPGPPASTGSAG